MAKKTVKKSKKICSKKKPVCKTKCSKEKCKNNLVVQDEVSVLLSPPQTLFGKIKSFFGL